jgi:hypothetical protein
MNAYPDPQAGFRRVPDATSERLRTWLNVVVPASGRSLFSYLGEYGVDLGELNAAITGDSMTVAAADALEAFAATVGA